MGSRYEKMKYQRCGKSGVFLPRISLGLWQNFGDTDSPTNARNIILRAFDLGITHFDLANNYGPLPGSAETNFGRILKKDLAAHRDELIISTKAGISNYHPAETRSAAAILRKLGTPCLIHQPCYNMLNRWIEDGLTGTTTKFPN